MEINGNITMLFNEDGLTIEITDSNACIQFLNIKLDSQKVCQAFGRLANIPCNIQLNGIEKIGKKMEHKQMYFILEDENYDTREKSAYQKALKICKEENEGFIPENYFRSQNSFNFENDKKLYARCTARRWV